MFCRNCSAKIAIRKLQTHYGNGIIHVAAPHIVRVIVLGAQCGVGVGPSKMLKLTWGDVDLSQLAKKVGRPPAFQAGFRRGSIAAAV
jgi:uncharacterized protein YbjT (DUF2867 family)